MAGVKGKCGGPRPNSGGARPGAGRKPKPKPEPVHVAVAGDRDPLALLLDIAFGVQATTPDQLRAAIAAVQYTHAKKGEGGKKDERAEAAKKAATGRFAASAAPLKLVNKS